MHSHSRHLAIRTNPATRTSRKELHRTHKHMHMPCTRDIGTAYACWENTPGEPFIRKSRSSQLHPKTLQTDQCNLHNHSIATPRYLVRSGLKTNLRAIAVSQCIYVHYETARIQISNTVTHQFRTRHRYTSISQTQFGLRLFFIPLARAVHNCTLSLFWGIVNIWHSKNGNYQLRLQWRWHCTYLYHYDIWKVNCLIFWPS